VASWEDDMKVDLTKTGFEGWRWMKGLRIVPGFISFITRYLFCKGKT